MGQTRRVQGRSTAILTDDDGWTKIIYHSTPVVSFTSERVRLQSGGWRTVTTKLRMNQASSQFRLGYGVSQKDFDWFVRLPDGREVPYEDGMEDRTMTFEPYCDTCGGSLGHPANGDWICARCERINATLAPKAALASHWPEGMREAADRISRRFSRNPQLAPPLRFEPTPKRVGDIVI